MANNWYTQLTSLAKTDEMAKAHLENLKAAETDEEKDAAKKIAMEYVESCKPTTAPQDEIIEVKVPEKPAYTPKTINPELPQVKVAEPKETKVEKFDPEAPALKEKYRAWGLNREEELFLAKGICLREMKRDERIKFRSAINAKKNAYYSKQQADWQQKQREQLERDLNDPEKIKWNHQRTLVKRIEEELQQHHNIIYIMKNVAGLTPAILHELLEKPETVNAFNVLDKDFINSFYTIYGQLKTKTKKD